VRVKCLAQEHNTMSPARARTCAACSGDEHTRQEATAPPTTDDVKDSKKHIYNEVIQYTWDNALML